MKWLPCLFVVMACSSPSKQPSTRPAPTAAGSNALAGETGPATACTRNDECHCLNFNGAEFIPGKLELSKCCVDASGCSDALAKPVPANHCMTCYYD